MPRIRRTVEAGPIREVSDIITGRIHTAGATRGPKERATTASQKAANKKRQLEATRWKLNANYKAGDIHAVFRYFGAVELDEAARDQKRLLRLLREWCASNRVKWRSAAVIEVKRTGHLCHHIILPKIPVSVMRVLWNRVAAGTVTATALDRRGNHGKLAEYLLKYSEATDRLWRALGSPRHRISWARGMVTPKPQYIVISSQGQEK